MTMVSCSKISSFSYQIPSTWYSIAEAMPKRIYPLTACKPFDAGVAPGQGFKRSGPLRGATPVAPRFPFYSRDRDGSPQGRDLLARLGSRQPGPQGSLN